MVPGCLTSESEERETWTAESLRAALLRRIFPYRKALQCGRPERDFGGLTFLGRHCSRAGGMRASGASLKSAGARMRKLSDLVKRCDQPGKSSQSKLESLILAQSERWRQA